MLAHYPYLGYLIASSCLLCMVFLFFLFFFFLCSNDSVSFCACSFPGLFSLCFLAGIFFLINDLYDFCHVASAFIFSVCSFVNLGHPHLGGRTSSVSLRR